MKDQPAATRTPGSVQIPEEALARVKADVGHQSTTALATELLARIRGGETTTALATELLARIRGGETIVRPGMLAKTVAAIGLHADLALDDHINRYSRSKNAQNLAILRRHPNFRPDLLKGATIVELGCGGLNPLGALLILLAAGARKVVGVDLEPIAEPEVALCALYRAACDALALPDRMFGRGYPLTAQEVFDNLASFDLQKMAAGDQAGLDTDRAQFLCASADDTGLESDSANANLSMSFLEHVPDPDRIVAEMARILAPGSIASHRIDGVDHRSYGQDLHKLEFLTEESNAPIVHECNRIRPLDFQVIFERHGFEVVSCTVYEQIEVPDALHKSMVEPFRSMTAECLGAVGVEYHLLKRS
jgi:SAM-dependent methyltransferase